MVINETLHDFTLDLGGAVSTNATHVHDGGLHKRTDLLDGLSESLLRVNHIGLAGLLQERHQFACSLVVLLDALSQNGRGEVVRVVFTEGKHPLLASILGTLQHEDTGWLNAILDKELCLEIGLREVFEEYARLQLF